MKVAIIGAGISGLYLALKLKERGEDVTVFEKRKKVGKEVCSGLFSERIIEYIPESKKLIKSKIDFCIVHFSKKNIKLNFSKTFYVMNHYELDNLVLELAEKAGVNFLYGKTISEKEFGDIEKEFDRIVGSDGANSFVRSYLKLKKPYFRVGMQCFIKEKNYSNWVDAWPTKNGFIWKIPRGEEVEWGIMEEEKNAKEFFYNFLKKQNINPNSVEIKSTIIPQGFIIPHNEKITILGDAAGLTKPWSGGGVAWGLIAANILLKNFPDFKKYYKEAKKTFLPKIVLSKNLIKLLPFIEKYAYFFVPKSIKIESDFLI
jgi:flavin-dependent dehydrogenase